MTGKSLEIVNLIFNGVQAIIGGAGVLFGAWQLWDGFTNDQPESKKKGITVLIVTAVVLGLLLTAKGIMI